jgi:hypothetical protein
MTERPIRTWMDRVSDIARAKLKQPAEFSCFYFEAVSGGLLVEGGIPRLLTRGPRKGKPTWRDCRRSKDTMRCIISDEELRTLDRGAK